MMQGRRLLSSVYGLLLDLFFPPRCLVCGGEGHFLHPGCRGALPHLEAPFCRRCAQPEVGPLCPRCQERPLALEGVGAPFRYEGPVREAVHRLKYGGERALARLLGGFLAEHFRAHPLPVEAIVPVPLHPQRERERGYNQALLLARSVGHETGLPVVERALRRVRTGPPQVQTATLPQRWENTRDAFRPGPIPLAGRSVLLVDDVMTSGATLDACARTLKGAGARSIWGLVLAREG